jgi:hypothetical protein
MIGEKRITTGCCRDDDSVSDIYTTDGTAVVDSKSQVSVSTGTADTAGASTPTTVVVAKKSNKKIRSSSILSTDSSQICAPGGNEDSLSGIFTTDRANATKEERFRVSALAEHFVHYFRGAKKKTFISNLLLSDKAETMIGEKVVRTGGGNRDDDSVSGIYTTDGTAAVDSKSRGARTRTAFTPGTPTLGAGVATSNSKIIFRSSSSNLSAGTDTDFFQMRAPPSDDDSMSGIYTTDGVSVTQEQDERFKASVLGEERKIHKEYYSASGSFESYPNSLLLPETLITAKTPSPDKNKKNKKKQNWSPFVGSVGANNFDLDSIASDDSMREGEIFRVLGTKIGVASSPMGRSTLGRAAVASSSYDDAFLDLAQGEGGYTGRSRGPNYYSSNAKKKAAAASAAASTSQIRPRVCGCRLVHLICVLTGIVVIALAVAFGALIATNHTEGGDDGAGASQNDFQAPTPSAPTPSKPSSTPSKLLPTFSQAPTLAEEPLLAPTAAPSLLGASSLLPTPAPSPKVAGLPTVTQADSPSMKPTKMTNTKLPSSSPIFVVSETASPTGLRASQGPSAVSLTVTQSPLAVPVTVTEQTQQSQSAPQSQSHRDPP